ncbi:RluA family pseudouridine synthase [Christensenellaceae bacterium NSJ-63]|uniref:Pseudouridine synthase n=1 Tax=Guopingia tenuis TaxID=2763656 RepID=A0A926DIX5_9FIRM|nr:RluA family pseudouridine synthase [Guopingia tenuis]MBC8538617.1 RluA family pseudouridine synthase [Guopingia tenuis]
MREEKSVTAGPEAARLDKYLSEVFPEHSRSFFQNCIENGQVLVDGRPARAKEKPREGSIITFFAEEPRELEAKPEDIPLDIVYEDGDIAVINKPKGMVVHPAPGNETGTLVNALLFHMKDLSGINGVLRPGIVHRLDKDTTGLLVIAKNDAAHISLAEQIREKTARREYTALVFGGFREEEGRVDAPIARHKTDRKRMAVVPGGREAVTLFQVAARYEKYTLLHLRLTTGRTHQIRVHMAYIGHPVAGDAVYTKQKFPYPTQGQMLHAHRLTLTHPRTGERMTFEAPLPAYFREILSRLREI